MRKKVGICFSKDLQGNTPLSHITVKLPVYIRLLEMISEAGWDPYVLTRKTYKGNGVFEGGWHFENGKFSLVKDELNIDLVYDRTGGVLFPIEGDHLNVINDRKFKIMAWDKWATYQLIGQYMPKTFLLENEKILPKILSQIKTDMVVLKPYAGLKGLGIFIGSKEDAMKFKLNKIYTPYIIQEFIDTSEGIADITPGMHDIRIVIVSGKPVWSHIRVPAKGSYLANAAQGGTLTELDYEVVPDSVKMIVGNVIKLFSSTFGNSIYSLDFGIGKGEKPYIFEINDQIGFPKWEMKKKDKFLEELITTFREKLSSI